MHGEQDSYGKKKQTFGGSSPYARGTVSVFASDYPAPRIIPVCTGNRTLTGKQTEWTQDHPRMHGEQ